MSAAWRADPVSALTVCTENSLKNFIYIYSRRCDDKANGKIQAWILFLLLFYFSRGAFQIPDGFTESRRSLSCYGRAGGAGSHKKEVACHMKSELELSGVLIDKYNKGKQQTKHYPEKKRKKEFSSQKLLTKS